MRALIFDLDGLIVDTETPDYEAWQQVYHDHGQDLPLEKWASIVGGTGASDFDPCDYLEEQAGGPVDREAIWIRRRKYYVERLDSQDCLPGVCDLIANAELMGLKMAVASSSPENWVVGHLRRLAILEKFACICTADDVEKTKPDPALFLAAAHDLDVSNTEAIVFEDSPNGVLAANRAGMYVVAVPNAVTRQLDLSHANEVMESLVGLDLDALMARAAQNEN
ncbi:MAG: HAD family hydrolase [Anaerolineae bacterium]|nr:MAG: HAD family hydrolase [Anaerolineae bacterium]